MCAHNLFELPSAPIWKVGSRRLILCRPYIMGILNVTPDSFSDGGTHNGVSEAMVSVGASKAELLANICFSASGCTRNLRIMLIR